MASLGWKTATRIAVRELRSSAGKFLFVVLSIAIGVAALTGVRGFSSAFRTTLLLRARSILAADLSARMAGEPTQRQLDQVYAFRAKGVAITQVTEMAGMASSQNAADPQLVSLKAVDPGQYPFYGEFTLAPQMSLPQALANSQVAVGDDLLVRLHLHVGDALRLGDASFRISSVVVSEPDRLSGSFSAGPRILLTQEELEATHLLEPGSRAGQRLLFRLPQRNDAAIAALKQQMETILPEAQVTDYRETSPAIRTALDQATSMLSLVSLIAIVLGAVGVAMAMRTHLLERLDSIAIMKVLGARSSHILRIYLVQTLVIGFAGGVLGVVLGAGVQLLLPLLLAKLLGMSPEVRVVPGAVFAGMAAAIVITVLFSIPPLLDIRNVRPVLIFRRGVEAAPEGHALRNAAAWLRRNTAKVIAGCLIAAAIALTSTYLSDSPRVGSVFTLGLAGTLLVLILASAGLIWLLRLVLRRAGFGLPSSVRQGLANLQRPGNPTAALLAALGLGVMQVATVFLVGHAFVRALDIATQPTLPNIFLIDVAHDELQGVRALLASQPAVKGVPEFVPVVTTRILSVNGVPAAQLRTKHFPKRLLRSAAVSWSDTLPPGDKVAAGQFWNAGESRPQLAIDEEEAKHLGVQVGSHIVFASPEDPDTPIDAVVSAMLHADGQHAWSRVEFLFPHAVLASLPSVWYGGAHADPSRVGEVQRAMYAKYPTVTVINVAQAMETLRSVLVQVATAVEFLAGFSVFAGLVILASAIAGTRYQRIREVVVLKALGGTRRRIVAAFSVEFATLGAISGLAGLVFANLVARVVLRRMDLESHYLFWPNLSAFLLVILLTVVSGWAASWRVLGQRPLEILREN